MIIKSPILQLTAIRGTTRTFDVEYREHYTEGWIWIGRVSVFPQGELVTHRGRLTAEQADRIKYSCSAGIYEL